MSFSFQFQIDPEIDENNDNSSITISNNSNEVNLSNQSFPPVSMHSTFGFPTNNLSHNTNIDASITSSTLSSSNSSSSLSSNINDTTIPSVTTSSSSTDSTPNVINETCQEIKINIANMLENWTNTSSVPEMLPINTLSTELYQIVVPSPIIQAATRQVDSCSGGVTWECTYDLLVYLQSFIPSLAISSVSPPSATTTSSSHTSHPLLSNKIIFDLGCGSGLLGILSLLYQPNYVYFHDYNANILQTITAANIAINLPILPYTKQSIQDKCTFLSGSWISLYDTLINNNNKNSTVNSLLHLPTQGSIDILLSSEILYKTNYYTILCKLLKYLLKPNTGRAYIATKRYYYGLGGGSLSFITEAKKENLFIQSINIIDNGKSMIREILEIQYNI